MVASNVNFNIIQSSVDQCCKTEEECGSCPKNKCLIGFSQIALDYATQKSSVRIPGGHKAIPQQDVKVYYQQDLIQALTNVLCQCQNCMDNHEADCIVNVVRLALELALLGDNRPYGGNAFTYLLSLSKEQPDLGTKLLNLYQEKKARTKQPEA